MLTVFLCIAILALLSFAAYAIHVVKPKWFRLNAAFWKASFMFEADSRDESREHPPDDGPEP